MTREEQIIEAGTYHLCGSRPPKTCGHNMHELAYITRNLAFEAGAKWADEHPKSEMVNKQEFIEKVIEWVKNRDNAEKYLHYRTSFIDDFADALRKYLEE